MIHFFPEDIYFEEPHEFTDPFRYTPVPAVKVAAEEVIKRIDADQNLKERFSEGKMIGILVCKTAKSLCYICAFSGNVDGKSFIEGFVPPIYDLTAQDGRYRTQETEISKLNHKIDKLLKSDILLKLKEELLKAKCNRDREISDLRMAMSISKRERDNLRKASLDSATTERLIK